MVSPHDFLPYVRRNISGPLNIMMADAVLQAAITFCRESLYCRRTVTLNPEAGVTYPLVSDNAPVSCTRIIRIATPDRELFAGDDVDISTDKSLKFRGTHDVVGVLFAVAPRADAKTVPDEILDYPEVIGDGAASLLFMQQGKPWQDPQRSAYFREKFTDGYRRAYRDALDISPVSPYRNPVRRQRFF
ncbi:TPA: hypothetical protein R3975_001048 [Salmonella enterica subsp. enterica serovar Muenchen]|nr:hypothetical protein [Salmonella enterica subsp. enterica]EGB0326528.1 hypothetical protein [Salmonella enterica]HEC7511686.1 hypothetical protein [Salmonella enterica subsp. enterica serovar Muenchen]HEC8456675.1 hypothetical protein [Salmonella enterica subsp. enterica serovar Poona]HEC8684652.1 hypothetical protein [Salmonella enterica subsp. enterica serovar Oranienburg]